MIPDAIAVSRKTLRAIKMNLVCAFGCEVAATPIAAAGLLDPLIAAGAMSVSSVLVVHICLRIHKVGGSRYVPSAHRRERLLPSYRRSYASRASSTSAM